MQNNFIRDELQLIDAMTNGMRISMTKKRNRIYPGKRRAVLLDSKPIVTRVKCSLVDSMFKDFKLMCSRNGYTTTEYTLP